jgi:hypothetical protein
MAMIGIATVVCLVLAVGVLATGGFRALRNEGAATSELVAAGLLEVGVFFYVGVRIADLIGGHRPHSMALAVAYLFGIILVMPVAAALGLAERSRWGPTVFVAGALVVCVLFARIDQVWLPHG